MQMGYDFEDPRKAAAGLGSGPAFAASWLDGGGALAEPRPAGSTPDWAALRARFMAVHALRRMLEDGTGRGLPGGGFLAAGRAVLLTCRSGDQAVNPFRSANSKAGARIDFPVVASPTLGDRGTE